MVLGFWKRQRKNSPVKDEQALTGRGSSLRVVAGYQLSWFGREWGGSWDMGFSFAKMEIILSKLGWLVTLVRKARSKVIKQPQDTDQLILPGFPFSRLLGRTTVFYDFAQSPWIIPSLNHIFFPDFSHTNSKLYKSRHLFINLPPTFTTVQQIPH